MHKYLHQQLVNAPLNHLMVSFPFIILEELLKLCLTKSVLKNTCTKQTVIGFDTDTEVNSTRLYEMILA